MFAPEPPLKEKWTEYRWASDGNWNEWHRTDTLYQEAFHKYRITYHNNMHLMMQNASAYLWGEAWRSANMSDSDKEKYAKDSNAYLKESYGYQLSTHLVEQVIKNHCKVDLMDVDSLEIRLKLKEPFLTEGKEKLAVESYFFPIHILDK